MIQDSGKPVVGHHMLLSLVNCYNQFVAVLPETSDQFKVELSKLFPTVFDTKFIAHACCAELGLTSTRLDQLYKHIQIQNFHTPIIEHAEGYDRYRRTVYPHEAGYDAFLAGSVFLRLMYKLEKIDSEIEPSSALCDNRFRNKLYLHHSDTPFSLGGLQETLDLTNVFHVLLRNISKGDERASLEKKAMDLNQLFSPFGKIRIKWINSNSAFVMILDKSPENLEEVQRKLIDQHIDPNFTVMTYDSFHSQSLKKSKHEGGEHNELFSEHEAENFSVVFTQKKTALIWSTTLLTGFLVGVGVSTLYFFSKRKLPIL